MAIEMSVLIARILAVAFLAIGLGALLNKNYYQKIMADVFRNYGVTLLYGIMALVFGFLIVTYHNVWVGWPVMITVVGWISIVRGFLFIAYPRFLQKFSKPVFKGSLGKLIPYTSIVVALVFGYFGFLG